LGFNVIEEAESRVRFGVQDWGPGISAEA
jgi:hypothetical protein